MHRFTMKELEEWSDRQILRIIIMDRMESTTNPYTPFVAKLKQLHTKLSDDSYQLGPLWNEG